MCVLMKYFLECTKCGMHFDEKYRSQICSACGAILDVKYKKFNFNRDRKRSGIWAYESMLPDAKYMHYAVGGTKLLQSNENPDLFLKLEIQNPTKSFKDRGSVIEVSKCLEYGYKEIVCASTGNMAFSIAYFAKLNNIKSKIFISSILLKNIIYLEPAALPSYATTPLILSDDSRLITVSEIPRLIT